RRVLVAVGHLRAEHLLDRERPGAGRDGDEPRDQQGRNDSHGSPFRRSPRQRATAETTVPAGRGRRKGAADSFTFTATHTVTGVNESRSRERNERNERM